MRLDQYMAEYWPEYSRSVWQKYIRLGYVTVDGEICIDPSRKLDEDSRVTADIPTTTKTQQDLPILYEDDNVIVINKPVGVLTHSKGALNEEFTVADFFRPKTTYHLDTDRPGIIHRLDRDTSGVLIGAKNDETARLLSRQFQDRKIKKVYMAVLDGIPQEPEANIDIPIERNPKAPSTFRAGANGKPAATHYKVVKSGEETALVELKPTTGRTHQLRVHMAHIGNPIKGDRIYGTAASRLFLHAASLEVTIPESKRVTFQAEVPPEFEEAVV